MDPPIKFTSDGGRRRAALRVKQKIRHDQQQWSPNGMRRRPRRRIASQQCLNHKPWNDRFIFNEESWTKECNAPAKIWKRSANGKENNNAETQVNKTNGNLRGQRSQMRCYTERSDGEAIAEFSRCEIFSSSPEAAGTTCLNLVKTHSIGTSPFDMGKVRAALEADVIDNHEDDELYPDNYHEHKFVGTMIDQDFIPSRVNEKYESSVNEKRPHHGPLFVPLDETAVNSFLWKFEELLYASELEEELIHRDIVKNQRDGDGCVTNIICEENDDNCLRSLIITTQRQDEINQYATRRCTYQNLQRELLTKNGELQYDAILSTFVESVLERIIEEISGELEEVIVEEMRIIVSNL